MSEPKVRIYTDGACSERYGGWGWWCETTDESKSGSEYPSTNQRMELYAALDALNEYYNYAEITIVSDSAYLVNCFGERWWVKWLQNGWLNSKQDDVSNRDIWEPLLELVQSHGNVTFEKVKGHSGIPGNEMADQLATVEVIEKRKEMRASGKEDEGRA